MVITQHERNLGSNVPEQVEQNISELSAVTTQMMGVNNLGLPETINSATNPVEDLRRHDTGSSNVK